MKERIEQGLRTQGWVPRDEIVDEVTKMLKSGWKYEEIIRSLKKDEVTE